MRKTQLALTLILAILPLMLSGIECVNLANANFVPAPTFTINLFSPEEAVYYSNSLTLNFSVVGSDWHNTVRYRFDEGNFQSVTNFKEVSQETMPPMNWFGKQYNWTQYTFLGTEVLSGLSDGNHSLTVYNGYVDPHGQFFENGDPVTVHFVIASASKDNQTSLYVASYIPGPWSQSSNSTTEGIMEGNIFLVNPTSNSLSNLKLAIQIDSSEIINPNLRLWDSNYTLNIPNSFLQSVHLFPDMINFSTPITSISIEPNQKETINLGIPSTETFQFGSHTLAIYISKNNFGDIINGSSLTIPQTEAYLQIVRYSPVESDEGTYHRYFNSTLNSNMVTVAYNPNFYQRYHNTSKHDYYADNFAIMRHMGVEDYTYFNVTVFNNNTFPVNSVALEGQIPSRGTYTNKLGGALIDYVMQPNETYLFPVSEAELPTYAYVTGYLTNSTLQVSNPQPTPTPSPTPSSETGALISPTTIIIAVVVLVSVIISLLFYRRHRKISSLSK